MKILQYCQDRLPEKEVFGRMEYQKDTTKGPIRIIPWTPEGNHQKIHQNNAMDTGRGNHWKIHQNEAMEMGRRQPTKNWIM